MKPYSYEPEFCYYEDDEALQVLINELAWVQRDAPRKEYWTNTLNRPYTYGRGVGQRTYEAQPPHILIDTVTMFLERKLGLRYEGCFLNYYADEQQHLGWHTDNDPGINHERPIAVVSFGSRRDIMVRGNPALIPDDEQGLFHEPVERINLTNGSLFLMNAGMQQTHQHRIPKAGEKRGPRVSLTFRSLI